MAWRYVLPHAGTGDQPHYSHPPPVNSKSPFQPPKTCQPRNLCRSLLSPSHHTFFLPRLPPAHLQPRVHPTAFFQRRTARPSFREYRVRSAKLASTTLRSAIAFQHLPVPPLGTFLPPEYESIAPREKRGRRARYIDTRSCTGVSAPDRRHGFRADPPQDGDAGLLRHTADNSS